MDENKIASPLNTNLHFIRYLDLRSCSVLLASAPVCARSGRASRVWWICLRESGCMCGWLYICLQKQLRWGCVVGVLEHVSSSTVSMPRYQSTLSYIARHYRHPQQPSPAELNASDSVLFTFDARHSNSNRRTEEQKQQHSSTAAPISTTPSTHQPIPIPYPYPQPTTHHQPPITPAPWPSQRIPFTTRSIFFIFLLLATR